MLIVDGGSNSGGGGGGWLVGDGREVAKGGGKSWGLVVGGWYLAKRWRSWIGVSTTAAFHPVAVISLDCYKRSVICSISSTLTSNCIDTTWTNIPLTVSYYQQDYWTTGYRWILGDGWNGGGIGCGGEINSMCIQPQV
ncbi:hypothetical protein M0802_011557 [Mischocyttarus mexicanus]|nr:hypothetical protein M0802_011557 [Mischocyttarus mexicanus]